MRVRTSVALATMALTGLLSLTGLAGCGQKGPLTLPAGAAPAAAPASGAAR